MTSIAADVLVALVALVTAIPSLVALRPALAQRLYGLDVAALLSGEKGRVLADGRAGRTA